MAFFLKSGYNLLDSPRLFEAPICLLPGIGRVVKQALGGVVWMSILADVGVRWLENKPPYVRFAVAARRPYLFLVEL